jgi:hypothetical protein
MSSPLLYDIAIYIISKGIASGDGVDIFRDFLPEQPDNLICLTEYQGDALTYYEKDVGHRSIQILVRNKNADEARTKALAICKALRQDRGNSVVDFTPERWGQVFIRQTPFKIGQDELDRISYGFNIGVTTTIE